MEYLLILIAVVFVMALAAWHRRKHRYERDEKIYADRLQLQSLIAEAERMFPSTDLYDSLTQLFDARAEALKHARALGDAGHAQVLRRTLIGDRILLAKEMARLLMERAEREQGFHHQIIH